MSVRHSRYQDEELGFVWVSDFVRFRIAVMNRFNRWGMAGLFFCAALGAGFPSSPVAEQASAIGEQQEKAAAVNFRVEIDYHKSPECEAFANASKTLIEEWYPKINEILFAPAHALPSDTVTLICEPMKAIAYSDIQKNQIHISATFVAAHPDDFGTVVHELTHIVQHYSKLKREQVWLQEGIADYVRHKYFEKDIDLLAKSVNSSDDSYRTGYRVTAAFLNWLQENKNPTIIRDVNQACAQGDCSENLFVRFCGKGVKGLWSEFINTLAPGAAGSAIYPVRLRESHPAAS